MKNWKTTLFGIIAAAAAFVVANPTCCGTTVRQIAVFIGCGGLAGLGIASKDATTHSTPEEVESAGQKDPETLP